MRSSTPQEANAKDQFFQQATKDAQDDTVIMVLTSLVPDPVRCRHSICSRPSVFHSVLEELLFLHLPPEVDGLRKKRLRTLCFQHGIFNYNNDIHATANDVTKGLIGPC